MYVFLNGYAYAEGSERLKENRNPWPGGGQNPELRKKNNINDHITDNSVIF